MFLTRSLFQLSYQLLKRWFFAFGLIMVFGLVGSPLWGSPKSQVSSEKSKESQKLKKGGQDSASPTSFCQMKANSKLNSGQKILKVEGMVCAFCIQGIEIHLKKLNGVKDIKVDLDEGEVKLDLDRDQEPTPPDLCEAIKRAGYKVTVIEHAP